MTIAREEIFGPVLVVIPYDGEEQAIAIANDSDFGLGRRRLVRRHRARRRGRDEDPHRHDHGEHAHAARLQAAPSAASRRAASGASSGPKASRPTRSTSRSSSPPAERPHELSGPARRRLVREHAVAGGPRGGRQIVRAEQAVDPREGGRRSSCRRLGVARRGASGGSAASRETSSEPAGARSAGSRADPRRLERHQHQVGQQSAAGAKPSTKSGTNATARVTTTSTRCSREPASQSIASLEWWIAWKRQSQGTAWKARWTA